VGPGDILAIAAGHKASGAVRRGAATVPKEDGLGELPIVFVRELGDIEGSLLQHDRPHFAEGAFTEVPELAACCCSNSTNN
jgi:hypothetical protein